MSRGRKPKSKDTNLSWQQIFNLNVGKYLQYIIIELSKVENHQIETGADLLKKIKKEERLKKKKELPPIKSGDIPYEIPNNWVWCRLGEICNYGSSPKAEPKDLTENTWVLDLEDIEKETSKLLNKIRFSERNSLSTKSVFNKGDVLYSKLRPYLDKVIVADEDGVCTTEILPLKIYGGVNPYFVMYALKRNDFLNYVNSVTKGMKMPRLGTMEGQLALMPLPPLSVQEKIVNFLTDFENENLRENSYYFDQEVEQKVIALHESHLNGVEISNELNHQLTLLKQLRQQFLQEAVQGVLIKNEKLKDKNSETGAALLARIKAEKATAGKKEKPLPPIKKEEIPFDIPDDWVWCRLSDVCLEIIDCPHSTPKYLSEETGYYGIDTTCINETGNIVRLRNLSKEGYLERVRRLIPKENDIIYAREGSIGLAAFIPKDKEICLGQRVMLFRPTNGVTPNFLKLLVTNDAYKNKLLEKHRGMGAKHVNVKDIVMSLTPLPPSVFKRK